MSNLATLIPGSRHKLPAECAACAVPVCAVCLSSPANGVSGATDATEALPRCYGCSFSTAGEFTPYPKTLHSCEDFPLPRWAGSYNRVFLSLVTGDPLPRYVNDRDGAVICSGEMSPGKRAPDPELCADLLAAIRPQTEAEKRADRQDRFPALLAEHPDHLEELTRWVETGR